MKTKIFLYLFAFFCLSSPLCALAQDATVSVVDPNQEASYQLITLKDGSQIKGRLVGIHGGMYSFETAAMGTIDIQMSNVASITDPRYVAAPTAVAPSSRVAQAINPSSPGAGHPKIADVQKQILSDPALLGQIQNMAQDPQIEQILSDPKFTAALLSQDMEAIKSDPRTQQLLSNPQMQQLLGEILQKMGPGLMSQPQENLNP